MQIGSLQVKNTKNLLSPDTRICALIYAPAKFGKTKFASSLDAFTRKRRNKPTLIIASEAAEGGGTMTLNDQEVDYVMPTSWNEMETLLASLATDEHYGGVILDNVTDYASRIVKPHVLSFPSKERVAGPRVIGVLQRSDYQVMGECVRTQLNRLVNLTNENTQAKYRKDLIVTALQKEKNDESGNLIGIVPDLPGSLAEAVTAMFNSVLSLNVKNSVVKQPDGSTTRVPGRVLISAADGMRRTDDRTGIFKSFHERLITDSSGNPIGINEIFDAYAPKMGESPKP
jgi:hypothetical protein